MPKGYIGIIAKHRKGRPPRISAVYAPNGKREMARRRKQMEKKNERT